MAMVLADQRSRQPALELRLQPAIDLSREQFFQFCQLNRDVRIERNAEGDIAVMAPTGGETGPGAAAWWPRSIAGPKKTAPASPSILRPASSCPTARCVRRMRRGSSAAVWPGSRPRTRSGSCRSAPNFVIELLSPSDSRAALQRKMEEYRANGARLGWLIDPARRQVAVYEAGGGSEPRVGRGVVTGGAVLPGFSLDLAAVFKPVF